MGDEVYRGGAFDPYNSASTSAKWRSAILARDLARQTLAAKVLDVMRADIGAARDLAKYALNKLFGRFAR